MNRLVAALLVLCATLLGCGSSHSDGVGSIQIPEGFEIEVAAGPPLVERPMIISRDDDGYLYVAESSGSNDEVQKQLEERPHSILRLEDVDGDGIYDRRTVFADRMMFPEGVLWHDGSVYVSAPPSIWKLTDTNGDGVADEREEWLDAKTLTNCANDLHGPYLGLDGWIYWTKGAFAEQTYDRQGGEPFVTRAAHIFRRRPAGGEVEPVLTGGMDNPVEVAFTPEGERLLTSTFLVHPQVGRRDGMVHAVYGGVYGKAHGVTDDHPMTGGYLPVMTHMGGAAPVGLARYESAVFGEDYTGRLFATSFNLRKVTSHKLVPSGATFVTEDADFLVSESRDFHPTDVMEDADGSLLVVDTGGWYKLCCPTAQLTKPDVLGAIYRLRKTGSTPMPNPLGQEIDWALADPTGLVALLGDPRPAVQRRALAALATDESIPALHRALSWHPVADMRRKAVWGLTRIENRLAREAVRAALSDKSESVRHAASHSAGLHRDWLASAGLAGLLRDESEAVRRAAAEALGRIGDRQAVGPLLDATGRTQDPILTHSLIYALIEIGDPASTTRGLQARSPRTRRAAMIALDQMRRGSLEPNTVISLLDSSDPLLAEAANWIAMRHPEWGSRLAGYLQNRLNSSSGSDPGGVAEQLAAYAGSPAVQTLLARAAQSARRTSARSVALDAMAAASLDELPDGWEQAVAAALGRAETLEPALVAARSLPRPEGGLPALDAALLEVALADSVDPEVRIRALDATGSIDELDGPLFDLATSQVLPTSAVRARAAAARVLVRAQLDRSQLILVSALLPDAGPLELPLLVEAFGRSDDAEVGSHLATGLAKAAGVSNLRADILAQASSRFPEDVRSQLDSLLAGEVVGLDEQSAAIDELLDSLPAGDIVGGQAVFNSTETACLACHAIGYQGGNIGPDLTRIGTIRERRDLLEALIYPSASFVRSYEPVVAVTSDTSYSGVRLEENDTHLMLALDADQQVRLARSDIEEMRPGTVSVMPSGLADQLTRDELADLLAFLEATEWGPRRESP